MLKKWLCVLLCLMFLPLVPVGMSENAATPLVRIRLTRLKLTDRADMTLEGSYTCVTSGDSTLSLPYGA